MEQTGEITGGASMYSNLIANISFCRLAASIQDRLVTSSHLNFAEISVLDAHLVHWYESLPSYMRAPLSCPPFLLLSRSSTKWRYQNLRIILHRTVLLDAALRGVRFNDLTMDEQVAVGKCQSIAKDAIDSIAAEWIQNQFSGWPAVWFLFNACLVPLLCLFSAAKAPDSRSPERELAWRQQVEMSIGLFEQMMVWSVAASKTKELISMLYEASKPQPMRPQDVTMDISGGEQQRPIDLIRGMSGEGQDNRNSLLWEGGFFDFPELDFPELGMGLNGSEYPMDTGLDWEEYDARFAYESNQR